MRLFAEEERDVKAQVKYIIQSTSENEYRLPTYPEIYRNAYYNYAYAEGDKIVRKLMRHPDLDNKLILPNNPNEICDIFGIEAARLFMVREYVTLIKSSDSYVTPVNIELLVDYQTTMGFLTPIHAIGSSKQGTSTLSAATFNDPVGAFKKASEIGRVDKINSISSCIMAGKPSRNGTGISSVTIPLPVNDFVSNPYRSRNETDEEFAPEHFSPTPDTTSIPSKILPDILSQLDLSFTPQPKTPPPQPKTPPPQPNSPDYDPYGTSQFTFDKEENTCPPPPKTNVPFDLSKF